MKISKGTIVRTTMIIIVILNIILKHFGFSIINISENEILSIFEMIIEVATIIVTFWKNNSFTKEAIKADELLKILKGSD